MKLTTIYLFLIVLEGMLLLTACNKADNFNATLHTLPQIDNGARYAYASSYTSGDTMTIVGKLNPNNDLKIKIGSALATIVASDTFYYKGHDGPSDTAAFQLDRVKIIITDAMGSGKNIPVSITSGGYTTMGASVTIYSAVGKGSLTTALKIADHAELPDPKDIFLSCINGKGDVYYYDHTAGNLQHIKKSGETETLLTAAQMMNSQFSLTAVLAGGVNPQGTMAWLSVQTNTGPALIQADLIRKSIKILNRTAEEKISTAPYSGTIDQVNLRANGVYPDSMGNVFLAVNRDKNRDQITDALAKYNNKDGSLTYLLRSATRNDIPGLGISSYGSLTDMRIQAEEGILYILQGRSIYVYDLQSKTLIKQVPIAAEQYNILPKKYMGAFTGLKIGITYNIFLPETCFGFLPMPDFRLNFLLYQYLNGQSENYNSNINSLVGGPKWMIFDFMEDRSYQYAPARAEISNYSFEPFEIYGIKSSSIYTDEMINYDEEGNLYMSANGRKKIVKTVTNK